MKRTFGLIFLLATSMHGQPLHKVGHYIKTHRELLLADGVVFASVSANAWTSVDCGRFYPYCVEGNSILGPHPPASHEWLGALGVGTAVNAWTHFVWHEAVKHPHSTPARHFIWAFDVGPTVVAAQHALHDSQGANFLSNERARCKQGIITGVCNLK